MLCAAPQTAACLLGSLSPEATDGHPWHRLHTTQAQPATDSSTNFRCHAKVSWGCCQFPALGMYTCLYSACESEQFQLVWVVQVTNLQLWLFRIVLQLKHSVTFT